MKPRSGRAFAGMYGPHAEYYDTIYHWKAYRDECDRLHELLAELGIRDGELVLDAACGTGGHLQHLRDWYRIEGFDRSDAMLTYSSDDLKLCRVSVGDRDEGDLSRLNFHWVAARRGAADVDHFEERHVLWLCPRQTQLDVFDAAGFDVRFEPDGLMVNRGLIIGRRRGGD